MDGVGSSSFGERILSQLCVSTKKIKTTPKKSNEGPSNPHWNNLSRTLFSRAEGQSHCIFITREDACSNGSE